MDNNNFPTSTEIQALEAETSRCFTAREAFGIAAVTCGGSFILGVLLDHFLAPAIAKKIADKKIEKDNIE